MAASPMRPSTGTDHVKTASEVPKLAQRTREDRPFEETQKNPRALHISALLSRLRICPSFGPRLSHPGEPLGTEGVEGRLSRTQSPTFGIPLFASQARSAARAE